MSTPGRASEVTAKVQRVRRKGREVAGRTWVGVWSFPIE